MPADQTEVLDVYELATGLSIKRKSMPAGLLRVMNTVAREWFAAQ